MSVLDRIAAAAVFEVPMAHRFRGVTVREGVLLRGPAGWGEFAPFRDHDDAACVPWLRAALESATEGWPAPVRDRVPVNAIIPVVDPDRAAEIVAASGCRTAKVKVAEAGVDPRADVRRVAAVRAALGAGGRIRIDANAAWTVDEAVAAIRLLGAAAGELEYVEQPCRTPAELAEVRRRTGVRIAADESIRLAADPGGAGRAARLSSAIDVAVVKVSPLGGVRGTLRTAAAIGLPAVVSSAVDTSVGLAAGVAAAAALPDLPFACGLGTGTLLAGDVTSRPLRAVGGFLSVPAAPPEPDRLAEFEAGPAAREFWLARLDRVAALADLRGR